MRTSVPSGMAAPVKFNSRANINLPFVYNINFFLFFFFCSFSSRRLTARFYPHTTKARNFD